MTDAVVDLNALTLDDAVEPVRLVPGTYKARLAEIKSGESSQKKTPFYQLSFETIEVVDADTSAIDGGVEALVGKKVSTERMWLMPNALFNFKSLLGGMGLTEETKGISLTAIKNDVLQSHIGDEYEITVKAEVMTDRNGTPVMDEATGEPRTLTHVSRVIPG